MTPADLEAALKSDPILDSHRQSEWNLFDQFVAACNYLNRGERLAKSRICSSAIAPLVSEDADFNVLRVAVLAAAQHLGITYKWTEPGCCLAKIAIKPPAKVYPPMAPVVTYADYIASLDDLTATATSAFQAATSSEELEAARSEFLGINGRLKEAQKALSHIFRDRLAAAQKLNEARLKLESVFSQNGFPIGWQAGQDESETVSVGHLPDGWQS